MVTARSCCRPAALALLLLPPAVADVALPIDANDAGPAVRETLFGHNLEFTRHDLFAGLSAQMIANRQFVLPPNGTKWPYAWDNGASFPPRWAPFGGATAARPGYAGPSTARVHCAGGGAACGVTQGAVAEGFNAGMGAGSALPLSAGGAYTVRVTAGADAAADPLKLTVSITCGGAPVLSTLIDVPADGAWHTVSAGVTAAAACDAADLSVGSRDASAGGGHGEFWLGAVSMLPAGHFHGMRRDVIERLKEIGWKGTLRFPGGCFAPFYQWRSALNEPDARPPALTPPDYCTAVAGGVNAYTDGAAENQLSTDEFLALCAEVGMQPSITLPLQFGTAAELDGVKGWVEYCNGGTDTPMGALRASRGHPAPYGVRHWYLGNEINMQRRYHNYPNDTSSVAHPSAAEYATIAAAGAAAVESAAPAPAGGLRLFMVGDGTAAWDGAVLRAVPSTALHAASYHHGYLDQNALQTAAELTAMAKGGNMLVDGARGMRPELDAASGPNRTILISADEWGLGPPWQVREFGAPHAMFAAALLGSSIRAADELGIGYANYFEVINEGGIKVAPSSAALTPLGEVLAVYARHQGCRLLATPAQASDRDVDAVASLRADGAAQLTLANFNAAQAARVAVTLANATAASAAEATVLAAAALGAAAPFNRSSWTRPVVDGALSVDLPPYSVAHVTVPLRV